MRAPVRVADRHGFDCLIDARSQSRNFAAWETRQTLETDDLSPAGVQVLAQAALDLVKGR